MAKNELPEFDERGCLPEGIYNPSVEEFMERFVKVTGRRKELFKKYQKFTKLCNESKGIETHYLDGSYVTDKKEPGDIDVLIIFNDNVYDSDKSYNSYFEVTSQKEKMKEDYEIHVFYAKNTTDADSLDMQIHWEKVRKKILEWWSRFYIDKENDIIDDKKKGFIVFNKDELQQVEVW